MTHMTHKYPHVPTWPGSAALAQSVGYVGYRFAGANMANMIGARSPMLLA